MKAFELIGKSEARIMNIQEPKLEKNENAIVRMKTVSICGTDREIYSGEIIARKLPIIMGHEGGGVIEEIRDNVQGVTERTKVLVDPNIFDGTCNLCAKGLRNLCEHGGLKGRDEDGIFAERISIGYDHLYPLPSSIREEIIPLIQPLSTVVRAMNTLKIDPGDDVLIIGLGATGLLFAKLCKLKGARVIGARRNWLDHMVQATKDFGVDFGINSSKDDLVEQVKEATKGRGPHTIIITASVPNLLQTCVELVRPGGTILQFFNIRGKSSFESWDVYMKEITMIATRSSVPSNFRDAIELASSGKVPLDKLITKRFDFADTLDAFHADEDRKQNIKIVIKV